MADLYPALAAAYPGLRFGPTEASAAGGADLVFCALPHGASQNWSPSYWARSATSSTWPPIFASRTRAFTRPGTAASTLAPNCSKKPFSGCPSSTVRRLAGARLVAAPGCYVTAATLALAPLVRTGAVERTGIVVDVASGVSGAGRRLAEDTQFCTVDEDFTAYGLRSTGTPRKWSRP